LVTSSTNAYGGTKGGDTTQSQREEWELAALADEKGRLHMEMRRRLLQRQGSSMSDSAVELDVSDSGLVDLPLGASKAKGAIKPSSPVKARKNGEHQAHSSSDDEYASRHSHDDAQSREALEAAARAQLRTKFDHVGLDGPMTNGAAVCDGDQDAR
jgi:hypothetical protein